MPPGLPTGCALLAVIDSAWVPVSPRARGVGERVNPGQQVREGCSGEP